MSNRLQPTLTDYVVIAINPALIMLLITSLVYFLLELFYQGHYPNLLHFCLWWFIFGIVLVSRISMEEGWDRAAPFGAALAIVVALAMNKFVSYQGTNLGEIGWMINYALMALIWWCAHQLTWDCTLIDETQDASGEGLLQTVGLDTQAPEKTEEKTAAVTALNPNSDSLLGSTVMPPAATDGKSWWQRFIERRRRPHAPGVWVVYFSLAALPLFGVGQAFIPAAKTDSRQNAFLLLCVYVACGLGLLMTTSFLALRRYLRQRRIEMPLTMAGTWLVMGGVLIISLLLLTALLPRPEAEYSISQLPGADSDEQSSSQIAAGKEGTKDDQAESGSGERKGKEEGESKTNGSQQSQSATDQKSQNDQSQKGGAKGEKSDQGESKGNDSSSKNNDSKPTESPQQSPVQIPPQFEISESILSRVKFLFYGALGLLVLYWSWRFRDELLAWLQSLFSGFSWGRSEKEHKAATAAPIRHRSFTQFRDPFATGLAARHSPEELVRYSFEAFEAWGRDNGWPRREDQTPNEFARTAGGRVEHFAAPSKALADLYNRLAYAPGSLPPTALEQVRAFWQAIPHTIQAPAKIVE